MPELTPDEENAFANARPAWMQDGKGVQGDVRVVSHQSAADYDRLGKAMASAVKGEERRSMQEPIVQPDIPPPKVQGEGGNASGNKQVIINDNGTLNFYNISATFVGPV